MSRWTNVYRLFYLYVKLLYICGCIGFNTKGFDKIKNPLDKLDI